MSHYIKRLAQVEIELAGASAPGAEFWIVADLEGIAGDLSCCGWTIVENPDDDALGMAIEITIPEGHERAYAEFGVCEAHWPK